MPESRHDRLYVMEATRGDVRAADFLYRQCRIAVMWEWIGALRAQQWEPKRKRRRGPFGIP